MEPRKKILFLCTGNSCRSQMAEAWCKALQGAVFEAYSAGVSPHGIDPVAARVMRESGLDISANRSKKISDLPVSPDSLDYVITICGSAQERCPLFPGKAKVLHRGFDDPPSLAANAHSDEELLDIYRRVRDEIRDFMQTLPAWLAANAG